MAMKYVEKFYTLEDGTKAGRWIGHDDVRGYTPPVGYTAEADQIEYNPVTGRFMGRSEWWIYLTPKRRKGLKP